MNECSTRDMEVESKGRGIRRNERLSKCLHVITGATECNGKYKINEAGCRRMFFYVFM